jgi:hypothetical protein
MHEGTGTVLEKILRVLTDFCGSGNGRECNRRLRCEVTAVEFPDVNTSRSHKDHQGSAGTRSSYEPQGCPASGERFKLPPARQTKHSGNLAGHMLYKSKSNGIFLQTFLTVKKRSRIAQI